jgi:hypothetical protein
MRSMLGFVTSCKAVVSVCTLFCCCFGQVQPTPPRTAQRSQRGFETPQAAADALIQAAQVYAVGALQKILGPSSEGLIASQDPVLEKNRAVAFAGQARRKKSVRMDPANSKRAILSVGEEDWPLPTPIVQRKGKW